ncbi:hypothetical protein BX666DRAFT_2094336 [Dichotomocladium elegans]|nr:hypothetical protein BX666DRAFT_2094336 [Dichotomocladium elegans]
MIPPMVPPTTPQPIPPIIQQQVLDLDGGDTTTNSQATAASEAATAATTRSNMRWTAAEEEILINAVKGKWDVLNATNGNIPIGRVWDQIFKEYYEKQPAGQPRRSRNAIQTRWGEILSDYKDDVQDEIHTGNGREDVPHRCSHYELMGTFLHDDPTVRPRNTIDSLGGETTTNQSHNQRTSVAALVDTRLQELVRLHNPSICLYVVLLRLDGLYQTSIEVVVD